jgi:hypothetical protein
LYFPFFLVERDLDINISNLNSDINGLTTYGAYLNLSDEEKTNLVTSQSSISGLLEGLEFNYGVKTLEQVRSDLVLLESNLNNYENKQVIFNVIKFFILS